MPKNILIFSDGTGQSGGIRPDQRLSNVYKLYRACRTGPDSPINPGEQVAFYDPGLGTDEDAASAPMKALRRLRKSLSAVTGRGITQNITDCYEFAINTYEPGDRIYLFGFSRGAYTARCIANLLALCGVPTKGRDGAEIIRYGPEARDIADEAVRKVYEHGAGRPAARFDGERSELARRFRQRFASGDDAESNVYPYFVGVFDTVASLGARGPVRFLMGAGFVVGALVPCALAAGLLQVLFAAPFWIAFGACALAVSIGFIVSSLRSTLHTIRDFPKPGNFRWHIAKWKMKNYDQRLPPKIDFARHAIAIDENRSDFPRVKWGFKKHVYERREGEPERFVQLWFAGNHSDIGGSYPEEQSRLSDIALGWMLEELDSLPHAPLVDQAKLRCFPNAKGMQHCEIDAMRDALARWLPFVPKHRVPSWKVTPRVEALEAPMHPTVDARFALANVLQHGRAAVYRPETLRTDPRYRGYYPAPPKVDEPG